MLTIQFYQIGNKLWATAGAAWSAAKHRLRHLLNGHVVYNSTSSKTSIITILELCLELVQLTV